jgi:hypothetical protein
MRLNWIETAKNVMRFVLTAVVAASAAGLLAPSVLAVISQNTIDPLVDLDGNGRRLSVTGPIACTRGDKLQLRVIVTQRSTGALAEGYFQGTCKGNLQRWSVEAITHGEAAFESGLAVASAVAVTRDRGRATDAHQWFADVTLAPTE